MGIPDDSDRWRATLLMAAPRLSLSPMLVRRFITDWRTSATTLVTRSRSMPSALACCSSAGRAASASMM